MTGSYYKDTSALVHKTTMSDVDAGLDFVFSDESEDSYNDVIRAKGWRFKNFAEGNPIALFNHNKDFIVGRWSNIRVEGNKLKGRLHLAPQGSSSRLDEIRALCGAGILRACSVGFRPIRSRPRAEGGIEYLEQELLECSIVAVGANASALLEARMLGVSNEVIKMVFRQRNKNASLAERITEARRNVRHYSEIEKREIMRRAEAALAGFKSKSQPRKLLTMSNEAKTETERIARNKEIIAKARATLARLKRKEYEAKRDPLPSTDNIWDNTMHVTWKGQKFRVQKQQWGGEDVVPDSHQKKTKWKGEDV